MLSAETRKVTLDQLANATYDLAIIGGGITGAGVARDAASRGMKVIVLEAKDFASGTSSRSSKLVHGGIRYLENLEFPLVHEALTERKILLETAPHLVHPLRFLMPIYKHSRVGRFKMSLGMILYDVLSLFESPQLHEHLGAEATKQKEPILKSEELKGSFIYSDAYMDDDRLVIETLRAAKKLGAEMVNYALVDRVNELSEGCRVSVRDELRGQRYEVQAKHVVGCLGPWTDIFGKSALENWKPILRPTKGSHIIFPKQKLPVHQAVVMAVEKRIIFVIPRGEMVIVGTTDTDFEGDPFGVNTEEQDVQYLLEAVNNYFPGRSLTAADIVSCYSGVRPLVDDGAQTEGKTSREHQIFRHSPRITCVAGGKYTTYRSMAEEIVDSVLKQFPFEERMMWKSPNTAVAINSAATEDKIWRCRLQSKHIAKEFKMPQTAIELLISRRGEEAYQILEKVNQLPVEMSWQEKLWSLEALFSIENELCLNLVDFYWRRSPLFLFHQNHGYEYLESIAQVFANRLGWSDSYKEEQISAVDVSIQRETKALASAMR